MRTLPRIHVVSRYDTVRDAILTCARKPTLVRGFTLIFLDIYLIYRTETTPKKCKTEKLKSKNGYAQK